MEYCRQWNPGEVLDKYYQICTNYLDQPADTCMSGVGGAVWCTGPHNRPTVYGLTAFGKTCHENGTPGVATNVPAFYGWIRSHQQNEESTCAGVTECEPGVCVESTTSPMYVVHYPGYVCQ